MGVLLFSAKCAALTGTVFRLYSLGYIGYRNDRVLVKNRVSLTGKMISGMKTEFLENSESEMG